jgi:cytosine permease
MIVVAGAYGSNMVPLKLSGEMNPLVLMKGHILNNQVADIVMVLLAISSFPPACISSFIAANSFKTTMPNVNPYLSVGIGTLIAVSLAVTGVAGNVVDVFKVIGASFGPVCGAMMADFLLAGRKWAGPRAGCNPAGWISWIVGFAVGAFPLVAGWTPALAPYKGIVPVPPVAAFIVGFVLYIVLAKMGLESRSLEYPETAK